MSGVRDPLRAPSLQRLTPHPPPLLCLVCRKVCGARLSADTAPRRDLPSAPPKDGHTSAPSPSGSTHLVPAALATVFPLYMPRRPGVAQIVPAKILNAGPFKRFLPRPCVDLLEVTPIDAPADLPSQLRSMLEGVTGADVAEMACPAPVAPTSPVAEPAGPG